MSVTVQVDLKDLLKDFSQYSEKVQTGVKNELGTTGREIETSYKIGVPVITSRLRSSIHTEDINFRRFAYNDKKGNSFDGSFTEKAGNELTVLVGTNVEYAGVIENGFSGIVNVTSFTRTRNGRAETVSAHTRRMNRVGNNALKNAFELHTSGLRNRISKILKP